MVAIPEEERHKYPIEGQTDKFYEQQYDMDSAKVFDEFIFAMAELREEVKNINEQNTIKQTNLPKLKKN